MTPWQIALALCILGVLIADVIYTRKMIALSRKHIAQTRDMLRAMGYNDSEDDEEE